MNIDAKFLTALYDRLQNLGKTKTNPSRDEFFEHKIAGVPVTLDAFAFESGPPQAKLQFQIRDAVVDFVFEIDDDGPDRMHDCEGVVKGINVTGTISDDDLSLLAA
jgi:hypothetical protein